MDKKLISDAIAAVDSADKAAKVSEMAAAVAKATDELTSAASLDEVNMRARVSSCSNQLRRELGMGGKFHS